jgi:hypothetical protein
MNTNTHTTCSCGCAAPHVVASRQTFDGAPVALWSDGAVVVTSEVTRRVNVGLETGWRVLANVELFDAAEVPGLAMAETRVGRRMVGAARLRLR